MHNNPNLKVLKHIKKFKLNISNSKSFIYFYYYYILAQSYSL